jgi:hypothetical protein
MVSQSPDLEIVMPRSVEVSPPSASVPLRDICCEYVIQPGDTLLGIALQFSVSVDDLVKWNAIDNLDFIVAGEKLVVPVATSSDQLSPP